MDHPSLLVEEAFHSLSEVEVEEDRVKNPLHLPPEVAVVQEVEVQDLDHHPLMNLPHTKLPHQEEPMTVKMDPREELFTLFWVEEEQEDLQVHLDHLLRRHPRNQPQDHPHHLVSMPRMRDSRLVWEEMQEVTPALPLHLLPMNLILFPVDP